MKRLIVSMAMALTFIADAFAQDNLQMFVTINGNYYLPRNSGKQVYPVIGFNNDATSKLLIGGLGAGFTALKNINNYLLWKVQGNISRRAYWNEAMTYTDQSNTPYGNAVGKGVDIVFGATGAVHYRVAGKFSVGTGFGFDVLAYSYSRVPDGFADNNVVTNGYYQPVVPLIPLEMTCALKKILFNVRYQHALTNRLTSPLSTYEKDNYSALMLEVGYRLR